MTNYTVWTYGVYLVVTIAATIWVAQTLHKHGRTFLIDAFAGNENLADSVNHLLVVGFYLLNFGYVAIVLRYGTKPRDFQEAIEFVSTKIGIVLLMLGVIHLINVSIFSAFRRRALNQARLGYSSYASTPPTPPIAP